MTNDILGLVFCGAIGVLTFFITLLFIRNRERIYAYYALFLVFILIYTFINIQAQTKLDDLFNGHLRNNKRLFEPVTLLSFSFYIFFSIELLNIKRQNSSLFRFFNIWGICCVIYAIAYFLLFAYIFEFRSIIFACVRIVIFSLSFFLLIKIIREIKSPVKMEFVCGTLAYFIGSFVATLRFVYGDLPFPAFYQLPAYIYFLMGVLIETLFFASALGYRLYHANAEKQANKEQLLVQMMKNERLIKNMNQQLEASIIIKEKEITKKQQILKTQEKQILENEFEKKLLQSEMLANRMQMNPHFIFNCLNSIKYLIQANENEKAKSYLVLFSRFIRKILDTSAVNAIPLIDEIEITKNYLELEKKRFNDDFSFHIKNEISADLQQTLIPPLLLQPFVENAIWHGLMNSDKATKEIHINVYKKTNQIVIAILDNGIGRVKAVEMNQNKLKKSMGLNMVKNRIGLLSRHMGQEIQFQIADDIKNSEVQGTLVEIIIPLNNYKIDS